MFKIFNVTPNKFTVKQPTQFQNRKTTSSGIYNNVSLVSNSFNKFFLEKKRFLVRMFFITKSYFFISNIRNIFYFSNSFCTNRFFLNNQKKLRGSARTISHSNSLFVSNY